MTAEEFLLCLRRFVASKGTPSEIISDNAMQFKASKNVIDHAWKKVIRCEEVESYVSNNKIKWTYIVELAPWIGGFYERLVGLVKRSFRKTMGRRLLTLVQLQTLLKEVESVLNSRPLVYVGDDINSSITLTPNHFLTLNPYTGIPEMDYDNMDEEYFPHDSTAKRLLNTWQKGQRLINDFWALWRNEYLLSLRERKETRIKTGRIHSQYLPQTDDVVLIKDNIPRGQWRLGKVQKLVKSHDGNIRSVKVQMSSGRILGRPLNLLYPIEISRETARDTVSIVPKEDIPQGPRLKRKAAEIAKGRISEIAEH